MSEEEKKAIEYWKRDIKFYHYNTQLASEHYAQIVLNLIQKQVEEIKKLKEDISNMYDEKVVRNILEDECGLSKHEIDEILN